MKTVQLSLADRSIAAATILYTSPSGKLAVHRVHGQLSTEKGPAAYRITHIATGFALPEVFGRLDVARRFARAVDGAPWGEIQSRKGKKNDQAFLACKAAFMTARTAMEMGCL